MSTIGYRCGCHIVYYTVTEINTKSMINTAPPFCPAIVGKRQICPKPIELPSVAIIKPILENVVMLPLESRVRKYEMAL